MFKKTLVCLCVQEALLHKFYYELDKSNDNT